MPTDRLRVVRTNGFYRIQWLVWLGGHYEAGAVLGEDMEWLGDAENKLAHRVIGEFGPSEDSYGWYWESKSEALKMARLARSALKNPDHIRPFPDWAKTAIRAGWKPPKNWMP